LARSDLAGLARGLGDPNRLLHERRQSLDVLDQRLDRALESAVRTQKSRLDTLSAKVRHPREKLQRMAEQSRSLGDRLNSASRQRVQSLSQNMQAQRFANRMLRASTRAVDQHQQVLKNAQRLLDSFANSRDRLLEQGYVWVSDTNGAVVPRAGSVNEGMALKLHFIDGAVDVIAGQDAAQPKPAKAPPRAKKPPKPADDQGSLL